MRIIKLEAFVSEMQFLNGNNTRKYKLFIAKIEHCIKFIPNNLHKFTVGIGGK